MTQFCSFLTCEPGFTVFLGNFIPAFRGFFAQKPALSVNKGNTRSKNCNIKMTGCHNIIVFFKVGFLHYNEYRLATVQIWLTVQIWPHIKQFNYPTFHCYSWFFISSTFISNSTEILTENRQQKTPGTENLDTLNQQMVGNSVLVCCFYGFINRPPNRKI